MMATEGQAAATTPKEAEKGTKNAKSDKEPATKTSPTAVPQPQPGAIDLKKAGQEKRMQAMRQRIVSGATTAASTDTASGTTARPRQFNATWGGKSTWGLSTGNDYVHAESEKVSNDVVDSIHSWAASSTRVMYNIWGNAGVSAPSISSNRRSSYGPGAPVE
jgi:hypothetical protein